ncbi:hypothetical protein ADUPG1_006558 [Aduncisulcus paluster]|uniref:Protein kinase domain-containing protein n=1 Tax=Aduncisulcus paluster TaxID=2918883 RepID=A0ABQ5KKB7_9EUKA|nr:hypothetical protein ADUPG1_006558 [Aduncisulcus paluster]
MDRIKEDLIEILKFTTNHSSSLSSYIPSSLPCELSILDDPSFFTTCESLFINFILPAISSKSSNEIFNTKDPIVCTLEFLGDMIMCSVGPLLQSYPKLSKLKKEFGGKPRDVFYPPFDWHIIDGLVDVHVSPSNSKKSSSSRSPSPFSCSSLSSSLSSSSFISSSSPSSSPSSSMKTIEIKLIDPSQDHQMLINAGVLAGTSSLKSKKIPKSELKPSKRTEFCMIPSSFGINLPYYYDPAISYRFPSALVKLLLETSKANLELFMSLESIVCSRTLYFTHAFLLAMSCRYYYHYYYTPGEELEKGFGAQIYDCHSKGFDRLYYGDDDSSRLVDDDCSHDYDRYHCQSHPSNAWKSSEMSQSGDYSSEGGSTTMPKSKKSKKCDSKISNKENGDYSYKFPFISHIKMILKKLVLLKEYSKPTSTFSCTLKSMDHDFLSYNDLLTLKGLLKDIYGYKCQFPAIISHYFDSSSTISSSSTSSSKKKKEKRKKKTDIPSNPSKLPFSLSYFSGSSIKLGSALSMLIGIVQVIHNDITYRFDLIKKSRKRGEKTEQEKTQISMIFKSLSIYESVFVSELENIRSFLEKLPNRLICVKWDSPSKKTPSSIADHKDIIDNLHGMCDLLVTMLDQLEKKGEELILAEKKLIDQTRKKNLKARKSKSSLKSSSSTSSIIFDSTSSSSSSSLSSSKPKRKIQESIELPCSSYNLLSTSSSDHTDTTPLHPHLSDGEVFFSAQLSTSIKPSTALMRKKKRSACESPSFSPYCFHIDIPSPWFDLPKSPSIISKGYPKEEELTRQPNPIIFMPKSIKSTLPCFCSKTSERCIGSGGFGKVYKIKIEKAKLFNSSKQWSSLRINMWKWWNPYGVSKTKKFNPIIYRPDPKLFRKCDIYSHLTDGISPSSSSSSPSSSSASSSASSSSSSSSSPKSIWGSSNTYALKEFTSRARDELLTSLKGCSQNHDRFIEKVQLLHQEIEKGFHTCLNYCTTCSKIQDYSCGTTSTKIRVVPRIYAVFISDCLDESLDRSIYLLMELCDSDLTRFIKYLHDNHRLVTPGRKPYYISFPLSYVLVQICFAIMDCCYVLHKASKNHGDIKPANFLVTKSTLRVKIDGSERTMDKSPTDPALCIVIADLDHSQERPEGTKTISTPQQYASRSDTRRRPMPTDVTKDIPTPDRVYSEKYSPPPELSGLIDKDFFAFGITLFEVFAPTKMVKKRCDKVLLKQKPPAFEEIRRILEIEVDESGFARQVKMAPIGKEGELGLKLYLAIGNLQKAALDPSKSSNIFSKGKTISEKYSRLLHPLRYKTWKK